MPKDFKGHLEADDPRNVLWSAGGCWWPTIPPYRIRLGSENATGVWEFLRTIGVLFEPSGEETHDNTIWLAISPLPPLLDTAWIWRSYSRDNQTLRWTIFLNSPLHHTPWEITDLRDTPVLGNRDVLIEGYTWEYVHPSPGSPLTLAQVYFDEELPPDGWPPWT